MLTFSDALTSIAIDTWCRVGVAEAYEAAKQGLTPQTFRERRRAQWALTHTARQCTAIEVDHVRNRAWDQYELTLKEKFRLPFRFDLAHILRLGSNLARPRSTTGARVLHIRALEQLWQAGGFSVESGTLLCGLGPDAFDVVGVNRIDESMPPSAGEFGVCLPCSRCEEVAMRLVSSNDGVADFLTAVGSNDARAL